MATPMTPTLYEELYDLFLIRVDDYELTQLYNISDANFRMTLQGLLMLAIPEFDNCKQDLSQRNNSTEAFLIQLTDKEKSILSKLMVKQWFSKKIQDVTQFQGKLTDKDFKQHSEAQNLTSKQSYYNTIREEVDQDMNNYGYKNSDWV
jgi:hypothetical protein